MSQSAGGRNPDRLGDTDRRLPSATVANGPPIRQKIIDRNLPPATAAEGYPISRIPGTIAVPVKDLPPAMQANEQPPNVSNPFMMNSHENSS